MEIKAILIVGGHPAAQSKVCHEEERIGGVPLALCHVLGATVLERTLARLERAGVTSISVLVDSAWDYGHTTLSGSATQISFVHVNTSSELWTAAQVQFESLARECENVLVQRLGPYAEIDYQEFARYHLDQRNRLTEAVTPAGESLDCYLVCSSRRNDAAYLFRTQMRPERMPFFVSSGYSNSLRTAADLRRLTIDAFANRNSINPVGTELKPGVWVGPGVRIQQGARILAPCYIGARSVICASSVLTRAAVVEHHCLVDYGTVIESSSVLPYSHLGAGLEFMNSVIGFSYVAHLARGASIKVEDPRLVGMRRTGAFARTLDGAWELLSYLPRELTRGFRRQPVPAAPRALEMPALKPSGSAAREKEGEPVMPSLTAELISVRRYGDE